MNIRYCKRCNIIYKYGNDKLCSECIKAIDEVMVKIRSYIEKHPKADITQISKNTGESEKDIFYLLREGRLSFAYDNKKLRCLRCGMNIDSGRYCTNCIKQMKRDLKYAANQLKDIDKISEYQSYASDKRSLKDGKMYTIYRRKNHFD